jgi:hypothetical protein
MKMALRHYDKLLHSSPRSLSLMAYKLRRPRIGVECRLRTLSIASGSRAVDRHHPLQPQLPIIAARALVENSDPKPAPAIATQAPQADEAPARIQADACAFSRIV